MQNIDCIQNPEIHQDWDSCRSVEANVEPVRVLQPNQDSICRNVEAVEASLDLSDYLPEKIATPLKQVAEAMPTSPEMLLTTLLPVSASLIGTAASVQIWQGWTQPSIIWAMNIAPTGKLKSPTQKVIINPLWNIETQKSKTENNATDYIVKDFTMEALMLVHSDNARGLLAYRDELDGFFQSMNKYRQGKGDDQQNWLSLYDGEGIKVNRKTFEERRRIDKTAVSIAGSIQPKTLDKHLNEANNHSGFSSRWLYCYPEMPLAIYTGIECPDVSEILTQLYLKLERLPNDSVFTFTEEAKTFFVENWYNPTALTVHNNSNDAIKAVFSKSQGYCTRLALLLHCIQEVCQKEIPTDCDLIINSEISAETISKAIQLSQYFVNQAKKVFGITENDENNYPSEWLRLTEHSIKKGGWIDVRYAQQYAKPLVKSAAHAKELFLAMAKSGYGEIQSEGKSLKWRYLKPTEVPSTLLQNSESIAA